MKNEPEKRVHDVRRKSDRWAIRIGIAWVSILISYGKSFICS
jgi:hypothetical protein